MYTFEQVDQALVSESLDKALLKLKQYAQDMGTSRVTRWAALELAGYNTSNPHAVLPTYRQRVAIKSQMPNTPNAYATDIHIPVSHGVFDLLAQSWFWVEVATEGFSYTLPNASIGLISVKYEINKDELVAGIRAEARRQLLSMGHLKKRASTIEQRNTQGYDIPQFDAFICNRKMAAILRYRWEEANISFTSGAYLATIMLLGSVLEGVLFDKIWQFAILANQARSAPRDRFGKVQPLTRWTLSQLISVAHECGWLRHDIMTFSTVLRDYRNFIHPAEQLKQGSFTPDAQTCKMSWDVVLAALSQLASA